MAEELPIKKPSEPAKKPAEDAPAKKTGTVKVKLLRASWDEEGTRIEKGTIIDIPLDHAKKLLAGGQAERADPLPGEEDDK